MITVLATGTAIGYSRDARAQAVRAETGRRASQSVSGQVESAVSQAAEQAHGGEGRSGVAGAATMGSWAGPIRPDEMRQVPRRLSSQERDLLREEIRRASEEVYERLRH